MADADRDALEEIGTRIRARRRELELTQEELAKHANVSKSFVSELESGSASASGLVYLRIAQALDVDIAWLLTGATRAPERGGAIGMLPIVSETADAQKWTHAFTLDVLAAVNGVVARRGKRWAPTREDVLKIAKALLETHERA